MSRRTISTSHTVVVCAVCGRTLLRGEHAEPFISGGQRRMVCELCAPRAVHEGWLREGFGDLGGGVPRGSRSRSLLSRIKQRTEDFFEGDQALDEPSNGHVAEERVLAPEPRDVHAVPTNSELKAARAVEVFNSSQQARMVAGVARSLGAPTVSVRPSETEGAVVSIVAAWEITWYRFEVDLGNEAAGVRQVENGTELDELEPEDLDANGAFADGALSLA
ncbi:MAG TPA: hypothetical protein VFB41_01290 [Solirubrobacteraceae bacterium]|nr:hypothetical protein [Solirubrobacteraceae bacterium]